MPFASRTPIFLTASTRSGFASFTASSAARFMLVTRSSACAPMPIIRITRSTRRSESGSGIFTFWLPRKPSSAPSCDTALSAPCTSASFSPCTVSWFERSAILTARAPPANVSAMKSTSKTLRSIRSPHGVRFRKARVAGYRTVPARCKRAGLRRLATRRFAACGGGEQRPEQHLEPLLSRMPGDPVPPHAGPVNDEEHGRGARPTVVVEERVAAHRGREGIGMPRPELARLARVLVDRERDDLQAGAAMPLVHARKLAQLGARGRAPGRPDHVHYDFADELARAENPAVEQRDVQLGSSLVRLECAPGSFAGGGVQHGGGGRGRA